MRAPRNIAHIGAIVFLVWHGQVVFGQGQLGSAPEAPREAGWVFTPSLGVGGSWDDNVLLANPGDNPPRDYASPINPGLSLDFTGRRTKFSTGYLGSFTFYRRVDELSSYEHYLRAQLQHRLTKRLTLFAENSFAQAPTTDALQLAGIPFYRIGSRTNTASGGLDAALNKYTTLRGRYTLRSVTFDFDEVSGRELRGGNAHEADLGIDRTMSERLTVGANYSLQRGTLNQLVPLEGEPAVLGDDQFTIQTGGGTVTYRALPTLTVNGGAGIARISGSATGEARTGPALQAGASWQGKYHVATVSYQRSFIPSFGFGGTFQNEEWVASIRVPFARNRAYTDATASWLTNEPFTPDQPDLRWIYISSRVGYRATPWLSLEGYYSRSQQNAQVAGSQLTRNQVGFQVVTSKPMKIR
jgi:hypothetical protein